MTGTCKYKLISPDTAGDSKNLLDNMEAEEGNHRIQALLADWLRMENVIVLTGAGSSFNAGGAIMSGEARNLGKLVLDVIRETNLSDDAKAIVDWKFQTDEGKANFESWLSYLFNVNGLVVDASPISAVTWKEKSCKDKKDIQINGLTISQENIVELQRYIEKAIYCECALELNRSEITENVDSTTGHIPFLAKLISRDANLGRTHIFTLNYDTLFEQAFEELGIQYFDGFSGKHSARFDPSVYGLDIYYPGDVAEGRVRRFDKFIHFYKLHGSIHWYFENGICKAQHNDFSFAKKYRKSELPSDKVKLIQSKEFDNINSFGILPTSKKFTQTLEMPYAHLFRLFHDRLNQPQTFLIVIGYGFGDDHVTRIIESALTNPSLIMLVVEPNPESQIVERIKKYQELGQRAFILTENVNEGKSCSYKTATFPDFAINVMPDVKWLEDFKRLRKFEEQIRKSTREKIEIIEGQR